MTYPIFEGDKSSSPVIAPRRPTLADFGGHEFEAALKFAPNDRRRPPLHGYMQLAMAMDRVCRSIPLLSIDFQTDVFPAVGTILFVNSVIDSLTTSTVTLTRPSSNTHILTWPLGSLPSKTHNAEGRHVGYLHPSKACRVTQSANQCTVSCYTETGGFANSTDYIFNISIWGE